MRINLLIILLLLIFFNLSFNLYAKYDGVNTAIQFHHTKYDYNTKKARKFTKKDEDFNKEKKLLKNLKKVDKIKVHIYDPPFIAKKILKSIKEAKWNTPEELLTSMISRDSKEWENNNSLNRNPLSKKGIEIKKKRDLEKNYNKLEFKFTFTYNGLPTAIIKYWFIREVNQLIPTVNFMQKIDNRWIIIPNIQGFDCLHMPITVLKPETLKRLLKPGLLKKKLVPYDNFFQTEIFNKTRNGQGSLDFTKLFNIIIELRKTQREKLKDYFYIR